ncbi:MAG TPA: ABC transporter ATP-binding protein [bacterium]|nr:ABC transporter ATP-binding protein [bacterium]
MSPILSLADITKTYGTRIKTQVLHGISLDVARGDFLAVTGQSGSGKTTLLNIMGLLDRPTDGKLLVNGIDTAAMDDESITALRGRTLGFVFQFHHLLPALTILENVMMPMMADKGSETPGMRDAAAELLKRVGLGERLKYKPDEVSGGQRQRAAIARALAMRPAVILADEPTGNLDTNSSAEVFTLLREINKADGTAFVIVTHAADIARQCDRIVEIVDGRLV